jgi:hypothetical protein
MTVRIAMPIITEGKRQKQNLGMPPLLAFLPMFARTNEGFKNPQYKGKKNRGNGR